MITTDLKSATGRDPSKPLLFMHIPKSAGRSFGAGLTSALQSSRVFNGFDECLFGDFTSFADFEPGLRRGIYLQREPHEANIELAIAHMSRSGLRRRFPNGQLITVLREPRSRLLSLWLYWRAMSDEDLAPWGGEWARRIKLSRLPLVEFLTSPEIACQTDNQVCRMLLWPHEHLPGSGFIAYDHDVGLADTAWATLSEFDLAVASEDAHLEGEVSDWLGSRFSIGSMNNAAAAKPERITNLDAELTAEARHLLEARSRLDLRLWSRIAASDADPSDAVSMADHYLHETITRHREAHAGREPAAPRTFR